MQSLLVESGNNIIVIDLTRQGSILKLRAQDLKMTVTGWPCIEDTDGNIRPVGLVLPDDYEPEHADN